MQIRCLAGGELMIATAAMWNEIRLHLEGMRREAMREIRAYPQPIAGCDAQIPVLWERRDAISAELARLDAAMRETAPGAVDAFLAASPVIDAADKERFRKAPAAPVKSAAE